MTTYYAATRGDNERRYGWDGGRDSKEYADDRCADRTHFILEPRHLTAEDQEKLGLSGTAEPPDSGPTEP